MFLQEFIFRLQTGNLFRGCTGFDGGFEVEEAIRGPDHDKTGFLKLNADNEFAVAA